MIVTFSVSTTALAQTGSISGSVIDEEDTPIEGAEITIRSRHSDPMNTQSDEEGTFTLEDVAIGTWLISASMQDVGEAQQVIEVNPDENTDVDLVLTEPDEEVGSISGIVTDQGNQPVDRATVTLSRNDEAFETTTDEDGQFAIREVTIGDWHIVAIHRDAGSAEEDIVIIAGEETIVNLMLAGGGGDEVGFIGGRVTDISNDPVRGATIIISTENQDRIETRTDLGGIFSIADVPTGNWHITATLENVGETEDDIIVIANRQTVVNLVLQPVNVQLLDKNVPIKTLLLNSFPNPFNSLAKVDYILSSAGMVKLSVFDLSGQHIKSLVDGRRSAGQHQITFDGTSYPAGLYIVRLTVGEQSRTQRLLLLK